MKERKIVNTIIIFELDNGEYAITSTKNEVLTHICASVLEYQNMPKEYFNDCPLGELVIKNGDKNEKR